MSEVITVEVAGKFGPKANGKWYGVKRPLKASDFIQGSSYKIETEAWESNGKNGVNIVSKEMTNQTEEVNTKKAVKTTKPSSAETVYKESSYDDKKNTRILRQGIVQAVVQSPLLAGLPFTNVDEAVALVRNVSTQLMEFVENN